MEWMVSPGGQPLPFLSGELDQSYFKGLQDIRPNVKFLASFGGTATPPELFAHLTMGHKRRAGFVQSLVRYATNYGFGGIDIAWLYPTQADKIGYVSLLRELREACDRRRLILTVTVPSNPSVIEKNYPVKELQQYAHYVILSANEFRKLKKTSLIAPLYSMTTGSTNSLDYHVTAWKLAGLNETKIVISIQTSSLTYKLLQRNEYRLGTPVAKLKVRPFYKICQKLYAGSLEIFEENTRCPYAFRDLNWYSYENKKSLEEKVEYAIGQSLGGIAVQSFDEDDPINACGDGTHPMTSTVLSKMEALKKTPKVGRSVIAQRSVPIVMDIDSYEEYSNVRIVDEDVPYSAVGPINEDDVAYIQPGSDGLNGGVSPYVVQQLPACGSCASGSVQPGLDVVYETQPQQGLIISAQPYQVVQQVQQFGQPVQQVVQQVTPTPCGSGGAVIISPQAYQVVQQQQQVVQQPQQVVQQQQPQVVQQFPQVVQQQQPQVVQQLPQVVQQPQQVVQQPQQVVQQPQQAVQPAAPCNTGVATPAPIVPCGCQQQQSQGSGGSPGIYLQPVQYVQQQPVQVQTQPASTGCSQCAGTGYVTAAPASSVLDGGSFSYTYSGNNAQPVQYVQQIVIDDSCDDEFMEGPSTQVPTTSLQVDTTTPCPPQPCPPVILANLDQTLAQQNPTLAGMLGISAGGSSLAGGCTSGGSAGFGGGGFGGGGIGLGLGGLNLGSGGSNGGFGGFNGGLGGLNSGILGSGGMNLGGLGSGGMNLGGMGSGGMNLGGLGSGGMNLGGMSSGGMNLGGLGSGGMNSGGLGSGSLNSGGFGGSGSSGSDSSGSGSPLFSEPKPVKVAKPPPKNAEFDPKRSRIGVIATGKVQPSPNSTCGAANRLANLLNNLNNGPNGNGSPFGNPNQQNPFGNPNQQNPGFSLGGSGFPLLGPSGASPNFNLFGGPRPMISVSGSATFQTTPAPSQALADLMSNMQSLSNMLPQLSALTAASQGGNPSAPGSSFNICPVDGIIPDPRNPKFYYLCRRGLPMCDENRFSCADGYVFNANSQKCVLSN